ncbi:MAG: hypothetical protein R3C17_03220 [Planctomycetaceae bacterium]
MTQKYYAQFCTGFRIVIFVSGLSALTPLAIFSQLNSCDEVDRHNRTASQIDISIDPRIAMQARQESARAMLVRNTASFNAYECEFVFSVWNRTLEFEDRKTLVSPIARELSGLVASQFEKADSKLLYETILLCATSVDSNDDFSRVLHLVESMPKSKGSVFCEVALQFADAGNGNIQRLRRIEQSLAGKNGDLQQLVSLNCARWLPLSDWHEAADRILRDPMTPLAAKLLALHLTTDAADANLHRMDIVIAGIKDEQRKGFHLAPYHLSDEPNSCRRIALEFIQRHLESFSKSERQNISKVLDEIPRAEITSFESIDYVEITDAINKKDAN